MDQMVSRRTKKETHKIGKLYVYVPTYLDPLVDIFYATNHLEGAFPIFKKTTAVCVCVRDNPTHAHKYVSFKTIRIQQGRRTRQALDLVFRTTSLDYLLCYVNLNKTHVRQSCGRKSSAKEAKKQ